MDLAAQVDTLTNSIDNGPEGVNGHAAVQYTHCLWEDWKKRKANHMMPASKGSQHTSAHNIVQECINNNYYYH